MKKLLIIACALSLPLGGCGTLMNGVVPAPATYAAMTKADEQTIVTAEQGYKAFRLAVEVGINAHLIHGPRAVQLQDYDNKLYAALQLMEKAYETSNSTSFTAALSNFNQFLSQANALTGGKD